MARILIVDDDEQVRTMLRHTLEREGFEVVEASNGYQALESYRAAPADVVLTDLIMPDMEGIETITSLRGQHPEAKIIAMSGGGYVGPQSYLDSARMVGAAYAFSKPIDREELLNAIRQLVA